MIFHVTNFFQVLETKYLLYQTILFYLFLDLLVIVEFIYPILKVIKFFNNWNITVNLRITVFFFFLYLCLVKLYIFVLIFYQGRGYVLFPHQKLSVMLSLLPGYSPNYANQSRYQLIKICQTFATPTWFTIALNSRSTNSTSSDHAVCQEFVSEFYCLYYPYPHY